MNVENKIRLIEKEVDGFFASHEFMKLPKSIAIQYLLFAYEFSNWSLMMGGKYKNHFERHAFNQGLKQGLTHSINWISMKDGTMQQVIEHVRKGQVEKAREFLDLAIDYHGAVSAYTMWSRNWATATLVDEKTVSFEYSEDAMNYDVLDAKLYTKRMSDTVDKHFQSIAPSIEEARETILKSITVSSKRTFAYSMNQIDWNEVLKHGQKIIEEFTLPPPNWTFGSLTSGCFRLFWAALCLIGMFNFFAFYHVLEKPITREIPLSNTIMVRRRTNWIKYLSRYTGLSREAISDLIEYHTYSFDHKKSDVVLTPFVNITATHLALAPSLITTSNLGRNCLKHLAKNYKDEYDRNSRAFEEHMINQFKQKFAGNYFKAITNTKIPGRSDLPDVDVCLVDEQRMEMMICEFKWTIPPADPSEIVDKMEIEEKALKQIKLLKDYFHENPIEAAGILELKAPIPVDEMYFVVVFENFVGTAQMFNANLPTIHNTIFSQLLRSEGSLKDVFKAIQERAFLPKKGVDYKAIDQTLQIGEYKIIWTGWAIP